MKISSVNSYNYTVFSARKTGKYAGKHSNNQQNNHSSKRVAMTVGGIGLAATTVLGAAAFIPGNAEKSQTTETRPSSAIVEVGELKPIEDYIPETLNLVPIEDYVPSTSSTPVITTRPQSERKAVWYEVSSGDRLADIVKQYAQLDKLTPDEELVPYYNLLESDNPGKWESRDKILIGTRFRVDSIMPENINITYPNASTSKPYVQEQIEEDATLPTEEPQLTSEEDKVVLNGNTFAFDLGTLDKKMFGDYEGLMYGKFVTIDAKVGGNLQMTKYEGSNDKSNVARELVYDKSGNITSITDYQDNKPSKVYTYVYRIDSTEETMTDKTAKSNQIDEVKTVYDSKEDKVNSREFFVNGKSVANFDFNTEIVKIGDSVFCLDADSFVCNDDSIGSKRYTGKLEGADVRFDVLKTGFCLEFVNSKGDIISREQYDSKGNFLCVE